MTHTALRITEHDADWQPKYFSVVTGLFCGLYMIVMTLVPKLIDLHGFILPAGTIIFPLCAIITDILTEVYGFNRARQAIWTALICTVLFAVSTQIAIALPPASFWPHQDGYAAIFATSFRMAVAGCVAWIIGELANSFVMSKMKILQHAKLMPVRFIASTIVGQFLDTFVFCLIAFVGTMATRDFMMMVVSVWAFKVIYEIIALPLTVPVTNLVKKWEGVEHFDRQKLALV